MLCSLDFLYKLQLNSIPVKSVSVCVYAPEGGVEFTPQITCAF